VREGHARQQVDVDRYNCVRLHSAIGYVTPNDMLAGRQAEIHTERDRKLVPTSRRRTAARCVTARIHGSHHK